MNDSRHQFEVHIHMASITDIAKLNASKTVSYNEQYALSPLSTRR